MDVFSFRMVYSYQVVFFTNSNINITKIASTNHRNFKTLKANEKICYLLIKSLMNKNEGLQCITGSNCHSLNEIILSTAVSLD